MTRSEIINKIWGLMQQLFAAQAPKPSLPLPHNPSDRIYQTALSFIGKDASPQDMAPDELGCAETVSDIIKAAGINIPLFLSTKSLYEYLNSSDAWVEIPNPEAGAVIISPTGYGNKKLSNGHTGICGNDRKIMSNSSATGTFEQNYTQESWKARYSLVGGYPIKYFINL